MGEATAASVTGAAAAKAPPIVSGGGAVEESFNGDPRRIAPIVFSVPLRSDPTFFLSSSFFSLPPFLPLLPSADVFLGPAQHARASLRKAFPESAGSKRAVAFRYALSSPRKTWRLHNFSSERVSNE